MGTLGLKNYIMMCFINSFQNYEHFKIAVTHVYQFVNNPPNHLLFQTFVKSNFDKSNSD